MILKFLVQMFVWMLVPFTDTVDMNLSKLQGTVEDRGAWHAIVYRIANSWTQLSN